MPQEQIEQLLITLDLGWVAVVIIISSRIQQLLRKLEMLMDLTTIRLLLLKRNKRDLVVVQLRAFLPHVVHVSRMAPIEWYLPIRIHQQQRMPTTINLILEILARSLRIYLATRTYHASHKQPLIKI